MTVASDVARVDYNGAGHNGPFTIPFYFINDSDILVIKTEISTGAAVTLALTTDYVLTGAGNPAGGTLVTVAVLPVTHKIAIIRDPVRTQLTDYTPNDKFPAESHETALDKLTMISQRAHEIISRSIRMPEGDAAVSVLPKSSDRANKFVGFDPSGNVTVLEGTAADASAMAFLQSGVGAVIRSVQSKLRDVKSVKDFGAVGDGVTDDTAAINAAIAAVGATKGALYFPAGNYKITNTISIPTGYGIAIIGDGPYKTFITLYHATANAIAVDNAGSQSGFGLFGVTIRAWEATGTGTGSTGTGLYLTNANDNTVVSGIDIQGFGNGIELSRCYNTFINNFRILYIKNNGIKLSDHVPPNGAGNHFSFGKISNYGFTGDNSASTGIRIQKTGGEYFTSIDITTFTWGVKVDPPIGSIVAYLFFNNVLADGSTAENWYFDGTSATLYSVHCLNCWGAYSTGASGLRTQGNNLQGLMWVGGRLRENGTNGWLHVGGTRVHVVGTAIASNSKASANVHAGVRVLADVSEWSIQDCSIGNFSSALSQQAESILIDAGASQNFIVHGNDCRNYGAGKVPISNGSTSLNWIVKDNLPLQTAGTNTSASIPLAMGSATVVAAGATAYLGPFGQNPFTGAGAWVVNKPGIVTKLYCAVTGAPGAGEVFTYTVMKNGVATAMTGTISGAATFMLSTTANQFTVAAQDYLDIRLVASGAAAAVYHRCYLSLEP